MVTVFLSMALACLSCFLGVHSYTGNRCWYFLCLVSSRRASSDAGVGGFVGYLVFEFVIFVSVLAALKLHIDDER
jgi:hypothetical protein